MLERGVLRRDQLRLVKVQRYKVRRISSALETATKASMDYAAFSPERQ